MLATVLSPVHVRCSDDRTDSFPLSWYPMFRSVRPDIEEPVAERVFARCQVNRLEPEG